MSGFRRLLESIGERLEATAARSPQAHADPPRINAYHGYANDAEAYVFGRLLRNEPVGPADPEDAWWRNLLNTYRRMETDETPGIRLRVALGERSVEAVSDDEGHFRARILLDGSLAGEGLWRDATVELVPPHGVSWPPVRAAAPVLFPDAGATFAVISDVDDTIIETNATKPLRMLRAVLFQNARTRDPFKGVPEFYTRLQRGTGAGRNPLFYISSSPWNLHDVLEEFLEHNGIPIGPLLLKDWGLPEPGMAKTGHREHKLARIEHLLGVYPELPFLLIGDNGQADPTIYAETAQRHPDRIMAVYIREVVDDERRRATMEDLARNVSGCGVEFLAFRETEEAAQRALAAGWIASADG